MKVIYTYTDEAPALATHSFLPVVEAFATAAGVGVETRDISLSGRILAAFGLVPDALAELGALATTPEANIIKLPNVSASLPQLKAAVAELQAAGHAVPDYPENPQTEEENAARAAYDAVKGSAVNPVLREGNSDRRAPASVKQFARSHPHSMGAWSPDSASHVSTMGTGDFRHSETSFTADAATTLRIEHVAADGTVTVLKPSLPILDGEIVDAAVMRRAALDAFLAEQIADAKERGVLFSVHLKATMMKVSDPILFGRAVVAYFADVFAQFGEELASVGADPNDGLASILTALEEAARRQAGGHREGHHRDLRVRARAGDGRLRPRHHQPARAVRHHRRRVDARRDPRVGADVERRGEAAGHEVRHPRFVLRAALRRDRRLLPRARRVRPHHDGHHAQRRAHGAEGRGVRQPRQDVPSARRRRHPRGRRRRTVRSAARRGRGRRLARLPDQGRADPQLGGARGRAGQGHRRARRLLARRDQGPRRRGAREGARAARRAGHRGADDRDPARRRGHPLHAGAGQARRGHDLGHRQRAARLPHRPLPHPRARHQREDALDRPADERRRPLRDRRGRLGAQARPAAA